jgi:hypothetical protein
MSNGRPPATPGQVIMAALIVFLVLAALVDVLWPHHYTADEKRESEVNWIAIQFCADVNGGWACARAHQDCEREWQIDNERHPAKFPAIADREGDYIKNCMASKIFHLQAIPNPTQ